jgi:hypothetical protein
MPEPTYRAAASDEDLRQILALQRKNLEDSLDPAEVVEQGFVTVRHDFEILRDMNDAARHVVAVSGGEVVGYALAMAPAFETRIPILQPMFAMLRQLEYQGRPLESYPYFVMGQVCVAKPFRGSGAFAGMYEALRREHSGTFEMVITEIAQRNTRSIRAHAKVGFELLHRFRAEDGEVWDVVVWDWR